MNIRLVIFSGIIMACIGSVFGLAMSRIASKPYQCCDVVAADLDVGYSQPRYPLVYVYTGTIMGFATGSILEALRQSKPKENHN